MRKNKCAVPKKSLVDILSSLLSYLVISGGNADSGGGICGRVELLLLILIPFVLIIDVVLSCLGFFGCADANESSLSSSMDPIGIDMGNGIETLFKSCGRGGNCGGCSIPHVGKPRMQSRCTGL